MAILWKEDDISRRKHENTLIGIVSIVPAAHFSAFALPNRQNRV